MPSVKDAGWDDWACGSWLPVSGVAFESDPCPARSAKLRISAEKASAPGELLAGRPADTAGAIPVF
jgi:hypothetical protein